MTRRKGLGTGRGRGPELEAQEKEAAREAEARWTSWGRKGKVDGREKRDDRDDEKRREADRARPRAAAPYRNRGKGEVGCEGPG